SAGLGMDEVRIGRHPVLAQIKTCDLVGCLDPDSYRLLQDDEDDQSEAEGPGEVHDDAEHLGDEEVRAPVEEARDPSVGPIGEDAEGQKAPGPVDSVDADRSDGVVDVKLPVHEPDAEDYQEPGDDPDQD